jgi:ubiquinone/menaquinone biosynthesis C-methylase UbiE
MNAPPADFDPLARWYRALEFLAFGRDLERARFCLLDRFADCHEILVLGEGDGRCLARLVEAAPLARIHCLDASVAMLARAASRLTTPATRARVTFEHADILSASFPAGYYDAVLTCFFLDCFTADQVAMIVTRVAACLRPDARWLFADFAVPSRSLARLRAKIWLWLLYTFVRWATGLGPRRLPPSEDVLHAVGFQPEAMRDFQGGLVRSVLLGRAARQPPAFTAA